MNRCLFSSAEILAESIRTSKKEKGQGRYEKKLGQFGAGFFTGFAITFLIGVVLLTTILWR